MGKWIEFPHAGDYKFDVVSLVNSWPRLHRGDCEPLPKDPAVLQAWVLFHNGEFESATVAGMTAGGHGITAANKATCVYATYLESREKAKLNLYMEAAARAEAQQAADPKNPNAWFWQAYAIGRYSQGVSVAKALAQGLGNKVKNALEHTIHLAPHHADAHISLAGFHAEVIDKVGALVGGMTYGAKKDVGLSLYEKGLRLNPVCPVVLIEVANGMVMLEGEKKMKDATRLYEQAAACSPADAAERLDVELAKAELEY